MFVFKLAVIGRSVRRVILRTRVRAITTVTAPGWEWRRWAAATAVHLRRRQCRRHVPCTVYWPVLINTRPERHRPEAARLRRRPTTAGAPDRVTEVTEVSRVRVRARAMVMDPSKPRPLRRDLPIRGEHALPQPSKTASSAHRASTGGNFFKVPLLFNFLSLKIILLHLNV